MPLRCVGLGEVLWDLLPSGRLLGGAPANFAYHAAALGAEGRVVSRVGNDEPGRALLARLRELGLPVDAIAVDPAAPTGTVSVAMEAGGHPRYTIHEGVAWDRLEAGPAGLAAVAAADAVCFGSLAQRTPGARAAIAGLLDATPAPALALRIFDVNLRQHYHSPEVLRTSLARANVLKVNETELPVLGAQLGLPAGERAALAALAAAYPLRAVIHTRGERGSLALVDGAWAEHPGERVEVADTVGAGDAFTAAFALGLLRGWAPAVILERATAVAAYVCTRPGATPELPPALTAPFRG
jgi:fructokinase